MTVVADSLPLFANGKLGSASLYSFYFEQAAGTERYAIRTGLTEAAKKYWDMNADGSVNTELREFPGYPFLIIPIEPALGVGEVVAGGIVNSKNDVYDLHGRRVTTSNLQRGIYIINGKKVVR